MRFNAVIVSMFPGTPNSCSQLPIAYCILPVAAVVALYGLPVHSVSNEAPFVFFIIPLR